MREVIRNYCVNATAHVMQKCGPQTRNAEVFCVLGVGSGDGKHDIEILKVVARNIRSSHGEHHKPLMHACIVEPSSSLIAGFKQSVSPLADELSTLADVSFDWRETTFEDFSVSLQSKSGLYHLIHFVCSLYYMDGEEALKKCYEALAIGGAMFCLVVGDDSFFANLRKRGCEIWDSVSNFYTGKDVVSIAERNNWRCEELPKMKYEVDITSCFDKSSQTGNILLDFLTHQINFRHSSLYDEMMDYITASSTSDNQGRRILRPEIAIVVIYK